MKIKVVFMLIGLMFLTNGLVYADMQNAVVKIFTTSNRMDYYHPWQSKGAKANIGSGFLIEGKRIMTNAHVVSDQTFIQVKKKSDPKKYTARLLAIGHDCDLAILTVDDESFYEGMTEIKIGDLPKLQEEVSVIGFPRGGDKLSITKGVVSRIEVTPYSHGARRLLTVQIDAAINAGNSGGPAIMNGRLVGVAMQAITNAQNIGYIIPTPIVKHFLDDLEDGNYDGFPSLGIGINTTENETLRGYFQMDKVDGGVLIANVYPYSPADGYIQPKDVVLKIDGVDIAEDGSYAFRGLERLYLSHLITEKQIGENLNVTLLRERKEEKGICSY